MSSKSTISFMIIFLLSLPAVAQGWKPLRKTCQETGDTAAEETLKMKVSAFEALDENSALAYLRTLLKDTSDSYYPTFLLFNSPSLKLADQLTRLNLSKLMEISCGRPASELSFATLFREVRPCLEAQFASLKQSHTSYAQHHSTVRPEVEKISQAQTMLNAICERLKIPEKSCRSNIVSFMAAVAPNGGSPAITIGQELAKISVDERLTSLSGRLVLHLLGLIEEASRTGVVKGEDIFTDLTRFFRAEGYGEKESRQLSLYYLGMYSTRGASFFSSMSDLHPKSLSALVVLSLAISYLDKIALTQNRSYAIPHEYKTTCSFGKPYHFWMAAFLADYAQAQGFSDIISYYAPVFSGIAYDITMDANGRDIKRLFAIKDPFDYYANMTRVDNAARAFGAHFGKHRGEIQSLNADDLLGDFFEKGRLPRNPEPKAEDFLKEYFYVIRPEELILRLSL